MSTRRSLYLITDTTIAPGKDPLEIFEEAASQGLDLLQIREPHMSDRKCFDFAVSVIGVVRPYGTKVLINDRFDIATALGADGVHLKSSGIPVDVVRRSTGAGFLIGVSTHSSMEALEAERKGADMVTFGPVFDTPSKAGYGRPLGVETLEKVASNIKADLYALGGIDLEKASEMAAIPFKGFAVQRAIMLSDNVRETVARFKSLDSRNE